jgi:hypothetical protein
MPSMLNEALEWLDRAEQAREVAGQLSDPGARRAVLELADSFDRLDRQALVHAAADAGILRGTESSHDSPLEGDGFEPSVPRQKDLCKGSPPIASTGGADRRESGESADLAPSLRHPKLVERLDGVRDAAGENSGCGVALQVLGSLPVRSSRPFIGEIPRKTRAGSTVPVSSDKDGRAAKGGVSWPAPQVRPALGGCKFRPLYFW